METPTSGIDLQKDQIIWYCRQQSFWQLKLRVLNLTFDIFYAHSDLHYIFQCDVLICFMNVYCRQFVGILWTEGRLISKKEQAVFNNLSRNYIS